MWIQGAGRQAKGFFHDSAEAFPRLAPARVQEIGQDAAFGAAGVNAFESALRKAETGSGICRYRAPAGGSLGQPAWSGVAIRVAFRGKEAGVGVQPGDC